LADESETLVNKWRLSGGRRRSICRDIQMEDVKENTVLEEERRRR